MKIALSLLLLLLSIPAFAADDAVMDDPLKNPEPSLGTDSGALLPEANPIDLEEEKTERTPRKVVRKKLEAPDELKLTSNTASVLTPNELKQAIEGDDGDGVLWELHEGSRNHVQLSWVIDAFPDRNYAPANAVKPKTMPLTGAKFQYQYFPVAGKMGRLGFGPSGGMYYASKSKTSGEPARAFTYGAKATYEFQYWVAQLFVPFVDFGVEHANLSSFDYDQNLATHNVAPAANFTSSFYSLGLMLNLNLLEPDAASRAIASNGIKKFYLAYAAENREGWNHNLGVRFEF